MALNSDPDREMAPFFIGGCPRSGLTLLRTMLDAHPALSCGPESPALSLALAARDIERTLGALHEDYFNLPRDRVRANFAAAIGKILFRRTERRGKLRAGEKSAMNVLAFADYARLFPNAQFLHLVRDGRDVASSLIERRWRNPATGAVLPQCETVLAAMRYWSALVGIGLAAERELGSRLLRVRYEDLCREPAETIAAICEFLRVERAQQPLDFHLRDGAGTDAERQNGFDPCKPVTTVRIGKWRQDAAMSVPNEGRQALLALGYA